MAEIYRGPIFRDRRKTEKVSLERLLKETEKAAAVLSMAVSRRNKATPPIKMGIWKKDGKLWYAERADIEKAIEAAGHSDEILKRKLGAGYAELLAALNGKRLTGWAVSHLEWGLTPERNEPKP